MKENTYLHLGSVSIHSPLEAGPYTELIQPFFFQKSLPLSGLLIPRPKWKHPCGSLQMHLPGG